MTINYYLNYDYRSNKDEKAIYCYIRDEGKSLCLHTKERVNPKYWDKTKQCAKRGLTGYAQLNEYLERYREKIREIIRRVRIEDPFIGFSEIKKAVLKEVKRKTTYSFFDALDIFINVRKPYLSIGTTQKYNALKSHLKKFSEKNKIDITFDNIDLAFFDLLHGYYVSKGIGTNTINKNMQFFKSFLRWAVTREFTRNEKFEKHKNPKMVETQKIALTNDEVMKLKNCKLSESMDKTRDLFFFLLYTGQRYSDIANFNMADIKDNTWFLRQEKTKKIVEIPLIEPAIMILEKYNYILPVISNQKMNNNLKIIGKKAKINDHIRDPKDKTGKNIIYRYELISTHTARRTFVSLSSYAGVNQQVVKSFTGHGSDKMVSQYFKKNNEESRKVFEEIFKN